MKKSSGVAGLVIVLVLACALGAWAWHTRNAGRQTVPQPVQQAEATPFPAATKTSTPAPVVYVPKPAPVRSAPAPTPSAVLTPGATAAPSAQPSPLGTPAPDVTLTPVNAQGPGAISDEPMVAATLGPHVVSVDPVRESPDAPPRILSLSLSTPVAHGGDMVSGTVETSSNVASVEARIGGYASSMQKVGVGRFALSYRVPNLPFFLHRTYTIEVIARNTRGDAVRSSVPITIR